MRRRRFIATTGLVVGAAGLAGCVGDGDDEPANGGAGNGDDENGDDANGDDDTDLPPEPDLDRIDTPPHEPERPPEPDDEDEWDAEWLGNGMEEEPSLGFEHVTATPRERELESPPSDDTEQAGSYAVTVIDSEETLAERINDPEELDVSFDEAVVLQIESGWGSSSVAHRWKRVEEHESGVHIHGYYTAPIVQTADVTSRHSVVVVEKPADEVELAHVSLTAGENRRVNFDSSEGVVSGD